MPKIVFVVSVSFAALALEACSSGSSSGVNVNVNGGGTGASNSGGTGNSGNAGGAGGSGNSGGGGAPSGMSFQQVRAASVKLSTCDGSEVGWGAGSWYGQFASTEPSSWPKLVECLLAASDCPAVLACDGFDANAPCVDATFQDSCASSSEEVYCDTLSNGLQLQGHKTCGSPLEKCVPDPGGVGVTCSSGTCTTNGQTCDGSVRVQCWDGVEGREDCAASGRVCASWTTSGGSFESTCVEAGTTCSASHCEDKKWVSCSSAAAKIQETWDCAWYGADYDCFEATDPDAGTSSHGCVAQQPNCAGAGEGATECQGSVARRCIGGRWWDFDCKTFLNGACALDKDGDARCKSPSWQ